MGKTKDFFKKTGDTKGEFHAKMGTNRDINGTDLTEARQGADCGSDHQLLVSKFRLKLKKGGKTSDHSGMT